MLKIEEARSKSYEERMAEVLSEIPLYSGEWTNFNASDPGITILENLTAFAALQEDSISRIPYEARLRLFALAGFFPGKGKCARVLLKAAGRGENQTLPPSTRFRLGDMIFETNRPAETGGRFTGIFGRIGGEFRDFSFLSDGNLPLGARAFGDAPRAGDALYLITDRLPEPGKELILYVKLMGEGIRNPVEDRMENLFADLTWECFTTAGFREMKVRDFTGCFLSSGEIRLRLPEEAAALCGEAPVKGYCVRAVLKKAAFDIPPRLFSIDGFLFEAWQRDTRAASLIFHRTDRITVRHPLAADEHILVFGKEEKGSSYRRYELTYTGEGAGRRCRYIPGIRRSDGRQEEFTLDFQVPGRDFRPSAKFKNPVCVILYSEEMMRRYMIGQVLGYDSQELSLPLQHLVQDSFCLIARRRDAEGAFLYDFVRPEKKEEGALHYHLLENDGKIVIEEAGDYIGADLFVGSAAVTEGKAGNVRAMSRFRLENDRRGLHFYNPGAGTGGSFRETLRELGERFRKDIDTPYTAVTAGDYEKIALSTPALCLRKAHAVIDETENLVKVAVLPATGEERPKLSETYRKAIHARLEERRLLTTRVQVLSPQYVEIHVRGTIYVKRHFDNPREEIEAALREALDDVHSDRGFGEPLRFRDIFSLLETLPCVAFVYDLFLMSEDSQLAKLKDSDIYPRYDVLCRPGEMSLEIVY